MFIALHLNYYCFYFSETEIVYNFSKIPSSKLHVKLTGGSQPLYGLTD